MVSCGFPMVRPDPQPDLKSNRPAQLARFFQIIHNYAHSVIRTAVAITYRPSCAQPHQAAPTNPHQLALTSASHAVPPALHSAHLQYFPLHRRSNDTDINAPPSQP